MKKQNTVAVLVAMIMTVLFCFDLNAQFWGPVPVKPGVPVSVPSGLYVTPYLQSPLRMAISPSSPASQIVAAGEVNVQILTVSFWSTAPAPNWIDRIGLTLVCGFSWDIPSVTVWYGPIQIGRGIFVGYDTETTIVLDNPIYVDSRGKELTIRVDTSPIGINLPVTESGHAVRIAINPLTTRAVTSYGCVVHPTGNVVSSSVRIFKSYPTFKRDEVPLTGISGPSLLAEFAVTANEHGDVDIMSFQFVFFAVGCRVDGINVYSHDGRISKVSHSVPDSSVADVNVIVHNFQGYVSSIRVPAGQTDYFRVVGNVVPTASEFFVTTTLMGSDSLKKAEEPLAIWGEGVVWSPNSVKTATLLDRDWFNAAGIPGLPKYGIFWICYR